MSNEKVRKSSVMFTTTDDAKNFGFILGDDDDREVVAKFTTRQDARDWVEQGNFFVDWSSDWDDKAPEEVEEMLSRVARYIWGECGDPGENGKKFMYDDHPYFKLSQEEYLDLCEGVGEFSYLK